MGAPLEDARHLAQRYDRMRQEGEAQVLLLRVCERFANYFQYLKDDVLICYCYIIEPRQAVEVARRQAKVRESAAHPDIALKLEAAEVKLQDLKSNVATLGKEASAAMAAVEAQQQRLTLQRLIAMVIISAYLSILNRIAGVVV